MRADFYAAMEAGRQRAKDLRDREGSTVRVYATARAAYANLPPASQLDELEHWFLEWRRDIERDCFMAVETALFAHEWDGLY